jgi:uncharacterized protein YqcC (DUF446 family)
MKTPPDESSERPRASRWRRFRIHHAPVKTALSQTLDQIEAEMKRIGYWQENPPDLQAMAARGEIHSCLDAPSFELWLQALFLPNARHAVQTDTLPSDSQVGLMAMRQYDYHSFVPEAQGLIKLLDEFDDLVRKHKR